MNALLLILNLIPISTPPSMEYNSAMQQDLRGPRGREATWQPKWVAGDKFCLCFGVKFSMSIIYLFWFCEIFLSDQRL